MVKETFIIKELSSTLENLYDTLKGRVSKDEIYDIATDIVSVATMTLSDSAVSKAEKLLEYMEGKK